MDGSGCWAPLTGPAVFVARHTRGRVSTGGRSGRHERLLRCAAFSMLAAVAALAAYMIAAPGEFGWAGAATFAASAA